MELIDVTDPSTAYYAEIPPRRSTKYWCMPEVVSTQFTPRYATAGESRSRVQVDGGFCTDAESHGFQ